MDPSGLPFAARLACQQLIEEPGCHPVFGPQRRTKRCESEGADG